jgi:hypothetical protein
LCYNGSIKSNNNHTGAITMTQYRITIDKFDTHHGTRYVATASTRDGFYTVDSDVWADEYQAVAEAESRIKAQIEGSAVEYVEQPTTNLDSLREYIQENDGLPLRKVETAPANAALEAYDMVMSHAESARMYRAMGYTAAAQEYEARGRVWARKWRAITAEQARDTAAGLAVAA